MSYQRERDEFIAAVTREGLPLHAALALLRAATGFQRRAELACSSEAADRDRVPCPQSKNRRHVCLCDAVPREHTTDKLIPHQPIPRITLQDWRAEQRLIRLLTEVNVQHGHYTGNETQKGLWTLATAGDPRGYTLRVIPPSYAERNVGRDVHNVDSIGVPSGPTRLHF